jgi:hypothetical protein
MSIDIDFTTAPPTLSDISEKRESAVNERAVYKKKNIRFTVTLLSIVVVYVTLMIIYIIPMITSAEEPDWGMITYFIPYFTFAIFVIGNDLHIKWIEKPSKLLDKTIADLSEGEVDEIHSLIKDTEQPGEIASYLEQVTAQGRSLLGVEINAIKEWHDANGATSK